MGICCSKSLDSQLYSAQVSNDFSLDGIECRARVESVYDGDTIRLIIIHPIFNNKSTKHKVRIMGYDSEEIRQPKSDPQREVKKKRAYEAKAALERLILGKIVKVKFGKDDKYGRPLADITIGSIPVSAYMINNSYGLPYDGGKKTEHNYSFI